MPLQEGKKRDEGKKREPTPFLAAALCRIASCIVPYGAGDATKGGMWCLLRHGRVRDECVVLSSLPARGDVTDVI